MKKSKSERGSQSKARNGKGNRPRPANRRRRASRGFAGLMGESLQNIKIADLYRPLKRTVTLRLDADVLGWLKKDGRRYRTRINTALRKVMERARKAS